MTTAPVCVPEPVPRVRVSAHPVPDADPPYEDAGPPVRLRTDRALTPYAASPAPAVELRLVTPAGGVPDGPAVPGQSPPASFEAVRTPRPDLEDPVPRAAMLTRALLEALDGVRPLGQLTRWVSPEVLAVMQSMIANRPGRPAPTSLRRVLVSEPVPGIAEVTAVVQRGTRAEALALRLEGLDGRWLVTALQRP